MDKETTFYRIGKYCLIAVGTLSLFTPMQSKAEKLNEYYMLYFDTEAECYKKQSRLGTIPPPGYVDDRGRLDSKISPLLYPGEPWDSDYPLFTYDFEVKPCDMIKIPSGKVISEKIKNLMQDFEVDAQFFEVGIQVRGKSYAKSKFYLVHHLAPLNFVDLKNSEIEFGDNLLPDRYDHGEFVSSERIEVLADVIAEKHMFTFSGNSILARQTFLSASLSRAIQDLQTNGVVVIPLSKIRIRNSFIRVAD